MFAANLSRCGKPRQIHRRERQFLFRTPLRTTSSKRLSSTATIASNPAAGLSPEPINHQDVLAATQGSAARVGDLLSALLPRV